MSLLSSVLGAVGGKGDEGGSGGGSAAILAVLGAVLAQSGGLSGLMNKFSQAGMGDTFSKWVSTGPNPPISGNQLQEVLGSEQVQALAAKLGIDPNQASQLLAQHLPGVVDKLTPQGQIDPNADNHQSLTSLLPSLLSAFTSQGSDPRAS